jgi:hypothetical protein
MVGASLWDLAFPAQQRCNPAGGCTVQDTGPAVILESVRPAPGDCCVFCSFGSDVHDITDWRASIWAG